MVILAACETTPRETTAQTPANCPPIPVTECPVCEARACPGAPVVERIVEKPVPVPQSPPATAGDLNLPVIGAVEWATVEPPGARLEARVDTGVDTTSLFTPDIRTLEKDGERYVEFDLVDPESGEVKKVEAELHRSVKLKRSDGTFERRYVVRLWVSVGENRSLIDVSLAERDVSQYPLLIGRNFLTDVAIVDVSRQHLLD